jgi:hypothetical protein
MFSLTNLFGKAMMYLVIALWKLEKPIVRRAPSGAFRYLYKQLVKLMRGGEKLGEKAISNI